MASGIYVITNTINGKRYIGSTSDLKKRRREHWNALAGGYHQNRHLQRSANRHGLGAFQFEILEEANPADLKSREQFYLDRLNPEYNMCPASDSMLGSRRSDETKARMSESAKRSSWIRGLPSHLHPMYGRKHSNETRQKMSINGKGKGAGQSRPSPSLETRLKMSAAKKGKPTWNEGRVHSDEHRANLRAAWMRRKERNPPKGPRSIISLAELHLLSWDKQRRNSLIAQRRRRLQELMIRMMIAAGVHS